RRASRATASSSARPPSRRCAASRTTSPRCATALSAASAWASSTTSRWATSSRPSRWSRFRGTDGRQRTRPAPCRDDQEDRRGGAREGDQGSPTRLRHRDRRARHRRPAAGLGVLHRPWRGGGARVHRGRARLRQGPPALDGGRRAGHPPDAHARVPPRRGAGDGRLARPRAPRGAPARSGARQAARERAVRGRPGPVQARRRGVALVARASADGPDGIVLVDKPAGWTSHDVVSRMRRVLGTRKVGHGGTLDPMATGLLVIAAGRATRLLTYYSGADKDYTATIRLGQSTVTDDAEGEVTASADASGVTDEAIAAAVAGLTGEILQRPSAVSAIKVGGERSYARVRAGEDVELPARPVTVSRFAV